MYTTKFTFENIVDGVKVRYNVCEHCEVMPTEADIKAAIKHERESWNIKCGICGADREVVAIDIYHYKDKDRNRWVSCTAYTKPMLRLNLGLGMSPSSNIPAHVDCAKKVFPYFVWPDLSGMI